MVLLQGRRVIYTDVEAITSENVIDVLNKAIITHIRNSVEISYLYGYYRGRQDIQKKQKKVRPEINHIVTENRANEIVSFKTGFLVGEPLEYVSRKSDEKYSESLIKLNDYVYLEGKKRKDQDLAEWFYICGTAFRITLPRDNNDENEAPFSINTLDPRNAFVVYSSALGHKPMLGVHYVKHEDGSCTYFAYSDTFLYVIENNRITNQFENFKGQPHLYGGIPIVEYPANNARLGSFEIVKEMLDAINQVASNRIDAIDQFIQSLMVFCNCDIDTTTFEQLKELGAIKYTSDSSNPASVDILNQELNQMETQTLVNYMYEVVLTICGMPNRNGGSSTSDTGTAVIMRDGWSAAESRAKAVQTMFEDSEKQTLKFITSFIREKDKDFDLPISAIKVSFTRGNYENLLQKAQTFTTLANCDKLHPKLPFDIVSGMFSDPDAAYNMSKDYIEEQQAELKQNLFEDATKMTAVAKQNTKNKPVEVEANAV